MFLPYQSIPVIGPFDVTYFRIDFSLEYTFDCLVIPNSFDGQTSRLNSDILCWEGTVERFILKQSIPVTCSSRNFVYCKLLQLQLVESLTSCILRCRDTR